MNRRYFGTDGLRGPYGGPLINESFSVRLAIAVGRWLKEGGSKPRSGQNSGSDRILIGRDTRASGESLMTAVSAGFAAEGWTAVSLGVVPTPAVARAVRVSGAALGVVITASHNPGTDNGIKFFGSDGRKLTDEQEARIESLLPTEDAAGEPGAGCESRIPEQALDAASDYMAMASALLPAGSLRGWRIALDTANGATCMTSSSVFRGFGAEVIGIGDSPDGHNINAGVGSEHAEELCLRVRASGACLGVAHDGDGDRCVLCDERGGLLDGDEIMAILATHALERGELIPRVLVATVQSNLGLDAAIAAAGGRVVRTAVGDRYVIAGMAAEGATLGGESSGHIVFSQISPTGDGLVAALKVIGVMLATGRPLSQLRRRLAKFPQGTATLEVREKKPLEALRSLGQAIRTLESELGSGGRVLVRYSGTEPKLRFLVEGPDEARVSASLARLISAARADLGATP